MAGSKHTESKSEGWSLWQICESNRSEPKIDIALQMLHCALLCILFCKLQCILVCKIALQMCHCTLLCILHTMHCTPHWASLVAMVKTLLWVTAGQSHCTLHIAFVQCKMQNTRCKMTDAYYTLHWILQSYKCKVHITCTMHYKIVLGVLLWLCEWQQLHQSEKLAAARQCYAYYLCKMQSAKCKMKIAQCIMHIA